VLGLAPSTVSKHLALLRAAALVEDRKQGRWIRYQLAADPANGHAAGVLALLRGALETADARRGADRAPLAAVRGRGRLGRAVPRAAAAAGRARAAPPGRAPAGRRRARRA